MTAAMAGNCSGEIGQDVEPLKIAGFGDGQQARRGQFAVGAAIAERDFSPLDASAERTFGAVVSGLDPWVFEESKQPLVMLEKSRGEITDLAVGTV